MREPRQIICEREFDTIARGVFGDMSRVDELLRAVEWTLAREISFEGYPLIRRIGGRELRALKVPAGRGYPSAIFLFTVEEQTVYLVSVIAADEKDTS